MRIGILRTDAVSADLAAAHGDYPDMFRALLADPGALPAGVCRPLFTDIDARAGELPEPAACDAYLITGSRHSVYDDLPWIAPLTEFLRRALDRRRRVVGVCFGHQLLARALGGEAGPAESGWCVGVHAATVIEQPGWMDPPVDEFRLLVSHRDQVLRLPPDAVTFAVAEQCPIAGFVLGDALAIQGHPEFTPAYAGALMDTRRDSLGEATYRTARASLDEETDAAVVARWMLRFMAGGSVSGDVS